MKHKMIILYCLLWTFTSLAAQLKCNVGIADITPEEPVYLAGFAAREGLSTIVHRPLKTHCIVIQKDTTRVCIITNDMMEISIDLAKELRKEIAGETGIPYNHIFIHCIHTHSAPRTGGSSTEPGGSNFAYKKKFVETVIANAIKTAGDKKAFQPFTLEVGQSECDINCNRGEIDGPINHEVYVVRLLNKKGKLIVSLLNFACHPVSLNYKSLVISPDFPGIAREELEKEWNCNLFYFTGASGNVDPCGILRNDTAYTQERGKQLADAVRNIRFTKLKVQNILSVKNEEIHLPYRIEQITAEAVNAHADEIKQKKGVSKSWPNDVEDWRQLILNRIANGEVKNYLSCEIAGVNVGGLLLLFSQGEPFNEYQTIIRKNMPGTPILYIAYTNGQNAYLPSKHAFQCNSYKYEKEQMHVYIKTPYPLSDTMPEVYEKAIKELLNNIIR